VPLKLTSCRLSCAYPAAADSISTPNNIVFFILRFYPFLNLRKLPPLRFEDPKAMHLRMASNTVTVTPIIVPVARPSWGVPQRKKAGELNSLPGLFPFLPAIIVGVPVEVRLPELRHQDVRRRAVAARQGKRRTSASDRP